MRKTQRSGCPINLTLEMIGDRWSLIVIRDVMFGNRRHYGDLLRLSEEGIASNILADRLARSSKRPSVVSNGQPDSQAKGHLQPYGSLDTTGTLAGPDGGMGTQAHSCI